jgi:uncharacterized protein HemX
MTDNTASGNTPTTDDRQAAVRNVRKGSLSGGLALILSVVALLASAYLGYTFIEKRGIYRADMFSRLDQLELQSSELQKIGGLHGEQLAALQLTQDTLKTGMEKALNVLDKGRGDWLLAETEQLMLIANHRLQLAHDVRLAAGALRAADRQLDQLANPRYLPVRKQLAGEISQLDALEKLDIPGMSLRLGDIATRIDRLPLATQTRLAADARDTSADEQTQGRSLAREMWTDITSLVRIRRDGEIRKPLLPPEQQYYLRENLRLLILGAQLALLQGEPATFEQNLRFASQWIGDYYDTSAPAIQSVQGELGRMSGTKLSTRLPDISGSLELLRKISGKKAGA